MLTLERYFLCFVFYSFVGWIYESLFYTIQQRKWVNTGFLNICICPIYGAGALLDWVLLHNIENYIQIFISAMVITCSLEYLISYLFEKMFHDRWWDYTNWPFNINGRVCLFGALAFGTMSVMLVKFIHPRTMEAVMSLSPTVLTAIALIAFVIIMTDTVITLTCMGTFENARNSFNSMIHKRIAHVQKVREAVYDALMENFEENYIVRKIRETINK